MPVTHLSGWYDPYARTAVENYAGLSKRGRAPNRLILGPWTHGDRSLTYAGDVDFGAAAAVDGNLADDFFGLRRAWFDRWVKGVDNGVEAEPPVQVFVMGGGSGRRNAAGRLDHGGRWRSAAAWPLPQTQWTPFYLHPDRSLRPAKPEASPPLAFRFDPHRPVPTVGGALSSGEPVMRGGAFDQRKVPQRLRRARTLSAALPTPGRAVVRHPAAHREIEIVGPVTVRLWVASDGPDTDFTAKLVDVHPPSADYPDGFAMNLTEGLLRLRYRDEWEQPTLMTPGEVYAVTIELFPIGNLFMPGHRLRLDISSSNFPHFDVNPNSGEPEGSMEHPRIAENRVFVDRERPSHIVLSIIP